LTVITHTRRTAEENCTQNTDGCRVDAHIICNYTFNTCHRNRASCRLGAAYIKKNKTMEKVKYTGCPQSGFTETVKYLTGIIVICVHSFIYKCWYHCGHASFSSIVNCNCPYLFVFENTFRVEC